jgi:sarcosine oxidase
MKSFDVIVIGVGAMGSSACFHLAQRGARVLGLEQFAIPNSLGSSAGESRMIRLCYYEHPDYVPLLKRAYQLWDELEQLSGQKLLFKTGGIYMGGAQSEFIRGTLRAAAEHQLPHEWLTHSELRHHYPQFVLPEDYLGVFEPYAGFLLPERTIATHALHAIQLGAELHGHEPVVSWSSDSNGVKVITAQSTYHARTIIFCGGAWTDQLLKNLGVELTVTRQVLGWVWPHQPQRFAMGTMPVWAINHPDNTQHYGFPMLHPSLSTRPGFKIAHHFHGEVISPQSINRLPQPQDENDFRAALRRFLPEADGPLLSMQVCMYTNTPDSHFIIDFLHGSKNVLVACGFSGHGFKFSSVIGEALADLAVGGTTKLPIGFLSLSRFLASHAR